MGPSVLERRGPLHGAGERGGEDGPREGERAVPQGVATLFLRTLAGAIVAREKRGVCEGARGVSREREARGSADRNREDSIRGIGNHWLFEAAQKRKRAGARRPRNQRARQPQRRHGGELRSDFAVRAC